LFFFFFLFLFFVPFQIDQLMQMEDEATITAAVVTSVPTPTAFASLVPLLIPAQAQPTPWFLRLPVGNQSLEHSLAHSTHSLERRTMQNAGCTSTG
jgi:Kef-type K+ transport system membrane component KefB